MAERISLRLPEDLVEYVEGMPARDGKDFSAKLIRLLQLGKEQDQWEKVVIENAKEVRKAAGAEDQNKTTESVG